MKLRDAHGERGAEPDECYVSAMPGKETRPTSPSRSFGRAALSTSCAVYAGLGVGEVWFWREGRIEVHVLRGGAYARVERSALLPALDVELLARFLTYDDQPGRRAEYLAQLGRSLRAGP